MELTIVRAGSELTPHGSIDLVSRKQLVDAGLQVLREQGSLTVNMSAVDFMDSVGIGAVVQPRRPPRTVAHLRWLTRRCPCSASSR